MPNAKEDIGRYAGPVEWLAARLREKIIAGEFAPHDFLPSERELARRTGVGRFHVRRALAQLAREGLIERHRYRGARVLGCARGASVAVVYPIVTSTGEQGPINHGVAERLHAAGFKVEMRPYHPYPESLPKKPPGVIALEHLADLPRRYVGVVFNEVSSPDLLETALEMERQRYPVTVANIELEVSVSGTRVDHEAIFRKAVETLVAFGHRRIGYVGNPPDLLFYGKTLTGYRAGLAATGLEEDDSLVVFAGHSDALGGYQAVVGLIDRSDRPTAIVATRDYFARGVCQAIEERGLAVGHDVSVIGYDDISWSLETPILTTFHEPCYELGSVAAEMLIERLVNGWRPPEQRVLEAPLVFRRSVGPPPTESVARLAAGDVRVRSPG